MLTVWLHWQVPVTSWFDDMSDTELLDLIPFFTELSKIDNVYTILRNANSPINHDNNLLPRAPDSEEDQILQNQT